MGLLREASVELRGQKGEGSFHSTSYPVPQPPTQVEKGLRGVDSPCLRTQD